MTYHEVLFSNVVMYRAAGLDRCRRFIEKISKMNPGSKFSFDFNTLSFDDGSDVKVMSVRKVHL